MANKLFNPTFRAQHLLFGFGIYRLILASGLCVLAFIPGALNEILPRSNQESLQLATLSYLVLTVLGMLFTVNEQLTKTPVTILLVTDLLLTILIVRYSGGVDSGLGSLLLITVGIGGLSLPLQQSLLVAAIASCSVVYTEMLPLSGDTDTDLLQAALLGIGYFVITAFLQYVGQRVKTTEQLARAQADTILDLRHLNELIVQRMRTGIIVITFDGAIRLVNDAARNLLNIEEKRPFWLNKPIYDRLQRWKESPEDTMNTYQVNSEHPVVSINFAKLQTTEHSDIIIFIEDTGRMSQQAQQLKLASLGRLTASIAHEIRNPLGAISHAAQLLEESPMLEIADKRLLSIIDTHTHRVNTIIETILELSRKRPNKIEKIKISDLIHDCIHEREMHTDQHNDNISLNLKEDCWIEINANQVKQVLHNLIDNGLRYSHHKTNKRSIEILVDKHPDNQQFYMEIQDQGEGVPSDQVKNLFEPFYTTENGGTGLGLYIAKELSEANRLLLSYISERPGGCFRLLFSHAISQTIQDNIAKEYN